MQCLTPLFQKEAFEIWGFVLGMELRSMSTTERVLSDEITGIT